MIKNKVDRLFQNKSFRFIFALVVSIALWSYVEYVENPDTTIQLSNLIVEYTGVDTLTENNLVVTDKDTSALNIRFVGKRNDVARLSDSNVTVTVDMSEIVHDGTAIAGIYQLSYTIQYPDDVGQDAVSVSDASADYVTVTVEKLIKRSIPVQITFDGDVAEGYQAEPLECSLTSITVSGSQAIVSALSCARANITGENISGTLEQETELVLIDADGKEVDKSQLTLSEETAVVTLPILMVKEVPLTVNLIEGVSATHLNTTVDYSFDFVTLAGDPKIIRDINQISLGSIDLTDFAVTTTREFPVTIPNDVQNLTGKNTCTVTVEVVGQSTRRLSVTNIDYTEATDGYAVTVITQSLDVLLRGPEGSLEAVIAENIRIIADLTSLGNATGTYYVAARVVIDGYTDIDVIGDYKVTIAVEQAAP